jgi:hypothetical protein
MKMRIVIYELRRNRDGFVIDESHPVAVITVKDGIGNIDIRDKRREKLLRNLFDNPVTSLVAGGRTMEGTWVDVATTHPAWSKQAIETIVGEKLRGHNLGGIITFDPL